jgi:hypothetical protein
MNIVRDFQREKKTLEFKIADPEVLALRPLAVGVTSENPACGSLNQDQQV